jgi:hypothetical protein
VSGKPLTDGFARPSTASAYASITLLLEGDGCDVVKSQGALAASR